MYQNAKKQMPKDVDPYLTQKIMSASPDQLISYIFDSGIAACGRKDREKASLAIQTLIKSLNFDYKEVAMSFYNVYRYVNHLIHLGKFDDAKTILVDIKKTWSQAFKVS